ncbi:hypothetical protein MKA27_13300 [[Clostridium] innocuum]|uniref:hypothetical protein n=1 Tax=Clostridium innocuum TaxID=1522 RepID=UPI000D6B15F7|nr:hypothetical protein [[Clostridium] innocuum]MCR0315286.1 hypothetical protein [[Clostridium] innocuum]MCR0369692.1 hypothetical protein [[Clostridium] innocuum]MCR0374796.1 hypothetical protein [[Clostridium] innocuum]MCR0559645.1 hypothetical protein [[Clostridium] innocuum]MCR0602661.1 hypothetical protein [[Clostridium] innocuum]
MNYEAFIKTTVGDALIYKSGKNMEYMCELKGKLLETEEAIVDIFTSSKKDVTMSKERMTVDYHDLEKIDTNRRQYLDCE